MPEQKTTWGHIIFIHKSYHEIVNKIKKIAKKQGKNELLHFLRSHISAICFNLYLFKLHSFPRNDVHWLKIKIQIYFENPKWLLKIAKKKWFTEIFNPFWANVSCNKIDIEVVISIKYGWNAIVWPKIIHLGYYPYQQQPIILHVKCISTQLKTSWNIPHIFFLSLFNLVHF